LSLTEDAKYCAQPQAGLTTDASAVRWVLGEHVLLLETHCRKVADHAHPCICRDGRGDPQRIFFLFFSISVAVEIMKPTLTTKRVKATPGCAAINGRRGISKTITWRQPGRVFVVC
jgi:hypothetical protein